MRVVYSHLTIKKNTTILLPGPVERREKTISAAHFLSLQLSCSLSDVDRTRSIAIAPSISRALGGVMQVSEARRSDLKSAVPTSTRPPKQQKARDRSVQF